MTNDADECDVKMKGMSHAHTHTHNNILHIYSLQVNIALVLEGILCRRRGVLQLNGLFFNFSSSSHQKESFFPCYFMLHSSECAWIYCLLGLLLGV